ncbi:MAG: DNA-binding protein [candidate division Zixibacteria bacterium RBG_16_48_11]|nr:MAG: DNA-binding protein [candidate division Zixibacteria bacterium RBG_16_48_11]
MKVGVLGSGDVGQVLGAGFIKYGHEVEMGTRDPQQEKVKNWVAKNGSRASAGTFAEAASFGEVLVLATHGVATENAIKLAGVKNFSGKVVIETTNPLDFSKGVPPTLSIGLTDSLGEQIQRLIPEAKVVKAFSIVGNAHMVNPQFPGGPPDMFICGNDTEAKKKVMEILKDFGWPAIDLGGIEMSRYLEPLAMVWIVHGFSSNTWNHAFKLLRK